ncbi:pyridoxal phosphate-dependent aminotransferase [Patescibacteria group bacterium]|nr:pyridoxal phosphate-dependent aminotransferase [Patescibacteria group bacterium]
MTDSKERKILYPPFAAHVEVMRPSPLRHFRQIANRRTMEGGDLDIAFHAEIGNNRLRTSLNTELLQAFGSLSPDDLCYSESDGLPALKEAWIPNFCPGARPEELFIDEGITGLLKRIARTYAGCGCLAFGPTYPNMIGICRDMGMNLYNWARLPQNDWAYPEKPELAKLIDGYQVGLLYLQPHSNPDGLVMSENVWDMMMELALEHRLIVISDEPYPHTNYGGLPTRSVTYYDDPSTRKRWIHLSGMSKVLECGLRLGAAYVPNRILQDKLAMGLQRDLSGPTPCAVAAASVLANSERFGQHLTELRDKARHHRDILLESLAALDPECFTVHTPQSSYYVPVTIEGNGNGASFAEFCAKHGKFQDSRGRKATVVISPIRPCYDGVEHTPCRMTAQTVHQSVGHSEFRLTFCYLDVDDLKEIGPGLQEIYGQYVKTL